LAYSVEKLDYQNADFPSLGPVECKMTSIRIRFDDAGIGGKPLTGHQTFVNTSTYDIFKQEPEGIAITESTMAVLRKSRMIGYFILQTQTTEPSIDQVQMYLFAQTPLRFDRSTALPDPQRTPRSRISVAAFGSQSGHW